MITKIISLIAPIGVILACFFSSLTGYSILCEMSSKIGRTQEIVLPSGHVIGIMGLVLFGMAVLATTLSSRSRSVVSLILLIGGMVALAIGAFVIILGIQRLNAAFVDSFNALYADANSWLQEADRARIPLFFGWGLVLLGATSICAGELIAKRISRSREKSLSSRIATAGALLATVIFLTSGIWSVISLNALTEGLAATEINPTDIAEGVRGVMDASFLEVIGIFFCVIAMLFMVIATYLSDFKTTD